MGKPPLDGSNRVYTIADLKPKFITALQDYFRKIKLGWYKKKKVNKSKTSHKRFYHMKFKIIVDDYLNPQESHVTYEMVVPARAVFFAKILLERSVKEKITVNVVDWEEMTEQEHSDFLTHKEEYETSKLNKPKCEHVWAPIGRRSENRFQCMNCHEEKTI